MKDALPIRDNLESVAILNDIKRVFKELFYGGSYEG